MTDEHEVDLDPAQTRATLAAYAALVEHDRNTRRGGPVSAAGRATSAQNSTTHGVMAKTPVIERLGESATEWEAFEIGVIESLAPVGELETELARRVALCLWRLRRCARAETAALTEQTHRPTIDIDGVGSGVVVATRGVPFEPINAHLPRYETHLTRQLNSALTTLHLVKQARAGERPAVARLDLVVDAAE